MSFKLLQVVVGAEDQELASWRGFKFTVLSSAGEIGKGEANRKAGLSI